VGESGKVEKKKGPSRVESLDRPKDLRHVILGKGFRITETPFGGFVERGKAEKREEEKVIKTLNLGTQVKPWTNDREEGIGGWKEAEGGKRSEKSAQEIKNKGELNNLKNKTSLLAEKYQ